MEKIMIDGGKKLNGKITLHGAKNSVLPILSASVLINGVSVIHNCPDLSDVKVTVNILRYLGASVKREGSTLIVDTTGICRSNILEKYMSELRSSIIFLGALAARTGNACLYLPGGCDIGLRPIDLHLKGLKSLGYFVYTEGSNVCASGNDITGTKIALQFPSVGATENIVFAQGTTTVINAAKEPEITDLINFLNKAGAKISFDSASVITIEGVKSLHSVEHTVIPDRILATTLMSAAAACRGDVLLDNAVINDIMPTLPVFEEMGCEIICGSNNVRIKSDKRLHSVRFIETMAFPGFPTDCQAPVMASLCVADGMSVIKETVFENRFKHTEQLNLFGADIAVKDRIAMVNGVEKLYPACAKCTDLRGGAAVVIAALTADGVSYISDIQHIDRGYERIENQLASLGANVTRIKDEKK